MLSWKGPSRITESTSWPCAGHPESRTVCLRALSQRFLNSDSLCAMATSMGNLFQCSTTFCVKISSLVPNLMNGESDWGSQWSELRKNLPLYLTDNVDATELTGLTALGFVPHWAVGFVLHLWISQTGFKMCGLLCSFLPAWIQWNAAALVSVPVSHRKVSNLTSL